MWCLWENQGRLLRGGALCWAWDGGQDVNWRRRWRKVSGRGTANRCLQECELWCELYLRRQRAPVSLGVDVFTRPVLCCLTPCSQVSGMGSLVPIVLTPVGHQGLASLVPGHLAPLLPVLFLYHLCSSLGVPAPLPRIHIEAQTLSSTDEARV